MTKKTLHTVYFGVSALTLLTVLVCGGGSGAPKAGGGSSSPVVRVPGGGAAAGPSPRPAAGAASDQVRQVHGPAVRPLPGNARVAFTGSG